MKYEPKLEKEMMCPIEYGLDIFGGKWKSRILCVLSSHWSKELLLREQDVQVLHGFDSVEHAEVYLKSEMFNNDVFVGLKPLWSADPDVKIYSVA